MMRRPNLSIKARYRRHRSSGPFLAVVAGALFASQVALPAAAGEVVAFASEAVPGTVIVMTGERRLYLVLDGDRAVRYAVGVGRPGRQWFGTVFIEGMYLRPNWSPPAEIRNDQPNLPDVIPGGSPSNPMGEAALTLSGGDYAIHGTNAPGSIGGFVSYGCIRMHNDDVRDLYQRVGIGTPVVVMR